MLAIRPITEADYEVVHAFQCEYLDQETQAQFLKRVGEKRAGDKCIGEKPVGEKSASDKCVNDGGSLYIVAYERGRGGGVRSEGALGGEQQNEHLQSEDVPFESWRSVESPCEDAQLAGQLVGICYGQPSRHNEGFIQLQGIAINHDASKNYLRQGFGSALLKYFEQEAVAKGYRGVDLGCADDARVERLYNKNGYHPYELVAKSAHGEDYERLAVQDYESGLLLKEELRQKYQAHEVIFIYRKWLTEEGRNK